MAVTISDLDGALRRQEADFDGALDRLFALLRIPSISTDPAYMEACREAADVLVAELDALGFEARVAPTQGHPMVVAHDHQAGPDAPHVLFYGHYDVQPVDPLDLWSQDPFDPQIVTRDNGSKMIRARGAADDKGQLRTFLEACRCWKAEGGRLPCRVTIFFEGEEESGSPSMEPFLQAHGDELKADVALVCDTGMWDRTTPAITMSLRGMAAGDVILKAASRDLHSGIYGSAARNPITVLSRILGALHDENGRVQLDGFYDAVVEPSAEVLARWKTLDFDPKAFLGEVGLSEPAGERDRSVLEQIWSRPTAEINGVIGGYTGEGFKTVIPAEARAKVSFRLVPDQDPVAVWAAFERFVRERLPEDCDVTFQERGGAPGIALSEDNPALKAAIGALQEEWGVSAVLMGGGGSIPIVGDFRRHLGMDSVMVGFGLDDDNIHSPDEKYELESFRKGTRSWIRILDALARAA